MKMVLVDVEERGKEGRNPFFGSRFLYPCAKPVVAIIGGGLGRACCTRVRACGPTEWAIE